MWGTNGVFIRHTITRIGEWQQQQQQGVQEEMVGCTMLLQSLCCCSYCCCGVEADTACGSAAVASVHISIVDSLEQITHSLCTLEFEVRRESYYWLLHELQLYKPTVWEYSRLNVEHSMMSKRKLLTLVTEGYASTNSNSSDWSDPRMMTVNGLRRRGYTAAAINNFCDAVGVTRNENVVPMSLLEHHGRQQLDAVAVRHMAVAVPVKVNILNFTEHIDTATPIAGVQQMVDNSSSNNSTARYELLSVPNFPKHESAGSHVIVLSSTLWLDAADVKSSDEAGFFGLAPGKEIHLKYAYNLRCTDVVAVDAVSGCITELNATIDRSNNTKCKGNLHWVSCLPSAAATPTTTELRLYDHLFNSTNPQELGSDWLSDLNSQSLTIVSDALVDPLLSLVAGDKVQFERMAFFCVDADSSSSKLVFNRTVTLKDGKKEDTKAATATVATPVAAAAKEKKPKK